MTNFLIDFLSRNRDKINTQAVETSRIFNELGRDKENIPPALSEAFSQRIPATLFKESFYAAYKKFYDYKESIEEQYQGQPIKQAQLINTDLTDVLEEHATELFNLYYLTLASTYVDIYDSTNFTKNDQVIQSEFSELLSKDTGKIIFSIAANISSITDKLFPILLEKDNFANITDESGNPIDEDGSLNANLAGSIINYIGQLGNRLQSIDDVRKFLKENETPERLLELQILRLEREINYGKTAEETEEIKHKYQTFIRLIEDFQENKTLPNEILLSKLTDLSEKSYNKPSERLDTINNSLTNLVEESAKDHAAILELREELKKAIKAEKQKANTNGETSSSKKGTGSPSWFKEKLELKNTLTGIGLFSQNKSINRGGKQQSEEVSPSSSPKA